MCPGIFQSWKGHKQTCFKGKTWSDTSPEACFPSNHCSSKWMPASLTTSYSLPLTVNGPLCAQQQQFASRSSAQSGKLVRESPAAVSCEYFDKIRLSWVQTGFRKAARFKEVIVLFRALKRSFFHQLMHEFTYPGIKLIIEKALSRQPLVFLLSNIFVEN